VQLAYSTLPCSSRATSTKTKLNKQSKKELERKRKSSNAAKSRPKSSCGTADVLGSDVVDEEPCQMCRFRYGDNNDPNRKDIWERCMRCNGWWHETCAAISGSYRKNSFTCYSCLAKRHKK